MIPALPGTHLIKVEPVLWVAKGRHSYPYRGKARLLMHLASQNYLRQRLRFKYGNKQWINKIHVKRTPYGLIWKYTNAGNESIALITPDLEFYLEPKPGDNIYKLQNRARTILDILLAAGLLAPNYGQSKNR